jgi:hypothetical protein
MDGWTMLDEVHRDEGLDVKHIVSLNWFDSLIFTHSKLPSYVSDDASHHYLSLSGRSSTYKRQGNLACRNRCSRGGHKALPTT